MADLAVTNTFVDATPAEATEVNTNFTDIVDYVNADLIRKDGSVAFTGAPSYAADPASANQLARKQYVDQYSIPTTVASGSVDLQVQPTAENQVLFGGGSAIVIADPGYNISVTAQGFISMNPSTQNNPLNLWEIKIKVNGTVQSVFRIPFVADGQSLPVVLPKQNLTTGGGSHTIQVFTENISATGYTGEVVSTSTTRSFVSAQWWRR